MRPRFELVVPGAPAEVRARLSRRLEEEPACLGVVVGSHVAFYLCDGERRYWSPYLTVDVEPHGSEETLVRGVFGPHPDVWTTFVAAYAVLGFSAFFALMFGLSQWMTKAAPTALWVLPAAALLAAAVYASALIGRRLARPEMRRLRLFLEEATGWVDPAARPA